MIETDLARGVRGLESMSRGRVQRGTLQRRVSRRWGRDQIRLWL